MNYYYHIETIANKAMMTMANIQKPKQEKATKGCVSEYIRIKVKVLS